MDNNTTPTPKKARSAWLYTLFAILVFAPTVIIIIMLMADGAKSAAANGNNEQSSVTEDSEAAKEPDSATDIYLRLTVNSILVGELPDEYADSAYIDIQTGVSNYKFYFSQDGKRAYYVLNGTSVYAVDARALSEFQASDASIDVEVRPPVLYFNGSTVAPSSSEYFYVLNSGAKVSLSYDQNESEGSLISKNSNIYLSFDLAPDECTVALYSEDKTVFWGDLKSLAERSFEEYESLYCRITAKWKERRGTLCGNANYMFTVEFNGGESDDREPVDTEPEVKPFECFLDTDNIAVGEHIVIKMLNVTDRELIEISTTPEMPCTSNLIELDGAYYAFVAVPLDASPEIYFVNVKYGDELKTLQYTVSPRVCKERNYDASDLLIKLTRTQSALDEYRTIMQTISSLPSQSSPSLDMAWDQESSVFRDSNIYLGFGHYRTLGDGTKYQMEGVDYRVTEGESIPAVASGTVVYAGYSQYLGKYIVIDHGAGIKTYYAHLSALSLSDGDTVAVGESVGCAGKTGFTSTSGVYLMCTVNGVIVSPYKILEGGILGANFSEGR